MSERKVKVGVVGLGNMGSSHIQWLTELPNTELTACCDIIPEKAEKFGKQYNVPYFTDSLEMIKSGLVEAVVLAVPHYFHTTIAIQAFENNLHVLTEKPVGVHKNDVLRMIAAHKAHPDKKFAAMFQMRMKPVYKRLHRLLQEGAFGKIQRINWTITDWFRSQAYYDSGTWRATWKGEGGGVLLNQCPHHIDLFQWFFGMPKTIRAKCAIGKYHHIEVEDEVTAFMEYENGATATFITSTGEMPGSNRLEIAGDKGRVVMVGDKIEFLQSEICTSEYIKTTTKLFGSAPYWIVEIPPPCGETDEGHKGVLKNFADAILNDTPLIAPAEEGLNSIELANSMLYSSMNDVTVNMPLDGDKFEKMLYGLIANSTFQKAEAGKTASTADMKASFH